MNKDYFVTVCDKCLTAACYHCDHVCDNFYRSSYKKMKASELIALKKEHPDNFSVERLIRNTGSIQYVDDEAGR